MPLNPFHFNPFHGTILSFVVVVVVAVITAPPLRSGLAAQYYFIGSRSSEICICQGAEEEKDCDNDDDKRHPCHAV